MSKISDEFPPEVKACPLCDRASVMATPTCEKEYRCNKCGKKFTEPVTRMRKAAGVPATGSQKILLEADPEEYP